MTLNELTLRKVMGELLQEVDQHIKVWLAEFQHTMQRVEGRAGKVLAQQVRDSAGGLQENVARGDSFARLDVQGMVEEIEKTHRSRPCSAGVRWARS